MSLDYSYNLGYGFFVNSTDMEYAGISTDENGVYETVWNELSHLPDGDLLKVIWSTSMDSSVDKVLVAIKRSAIECDAKAPEHTDEEPFVVENFGQVATSLENAALARAAEKFGVELFIPQTYFFITVS